MRVVNAVERGPDWAGLPVTATMARLLCRELTLQNQYLRVENQVLKEEVPRRIRFTDEERRPLMRMSSAREIAVRAVWRADEFLGNTRSGSTFGSLPPRFQGRETIMQ